MLFTDFDLPEVLSENIKNNGWERPTPIQELVLPRALEGADILGGAPTGTGKSAAFLIPIIAALLDEDSKKGTETERGSVFRALILEPTRELAQQTCEVAGRLCEGSSLEVGTIIGGAGRDLQREQSADILVATPGRFNEFLRKQWIDCSEVLYFVIDEADRMLDMGFRDDVVKISNELVYCRQNMLFSATLEGYGIREFATSVLEDPFEVRLGTGDDADEKLPENLSLRAYYAAGDQQKVKILLQLLSTVTGRAIVFVKTRDRIQKVHSSLRRAGISCATLQGELSQTERNAALRRFKESEARVLIATDVAARGLDLPEVATVYNFDMPGNATIFVHRAGRTARAGESGVAVCLVCADQIDLLERIERYIQKDIERRSIRNICAAFPTKETLGRHASDKKRARTSKPGGGFDKKTDEEKKKHRKVRARDVKNKGKPDFAKKRARREARRQTATGKQSE